MPIHQHTFALCGIFLLECCCIHLVHMNVAVPPQPTDAQPNLVEQVIALSAPPPLVIPPTSAGLIVPDLSRAVTTPAPGMPYHHGWLAPACSLMQLEKKKAASNGNVGLK